MRARPTILFLTALLAATPGALGALGADDDVELRIEVAVQGEMRASEAEALALVVDLDGREAYRRAWGAARSPADAVPAGALIETFLAVCVLQMVDEGKLELDAKLAELLPEPGFDEAIELRHVLQHTSGLPSYGAFAEGRRRAGAEAGVDELLKWLAASPADAAPGACAEVTDTNTLLLGALVARVDERPASNAIVARVFARAGMTDTRFGGDPPDVEGAWSAAREVGGDLSTRWDVTSDLGASELRSTADDLATFARALATGALLEGAQELLFDEARLDDGTPVPRVPGFERHTLAPGDVAMHGLGAGGALAGGRVHVAWYPDVDLAIAIVSDAADARLAVLERRIARMVLGLDEPGVVDEPTTAEDRARLQGSYYVGCSEYRVTEEGERLVMYPPAGPAYALLFQGGLRFVSSVDPDVEIEFIEAGDAIRGLWLTERGSRVEGKRM